LREHRHFEGTVVAWRSPSRVVGDSVLYHSLLGMASLATSLGFGTQLPEVPVFRPGEANSFLNTCRLVGTD
jgi:hypothetical protein